MILYGYYENRNCYSYFHSHIKYGYFFIVIIGI
nr:MAG TPA: hypothetical protein [Caudoviricetes sp.]